MKNLFFRSSSYLSSIDPIKILILPNRSGLNKAVSIFFNEKSRNNLLLTDVV